MTSPYPSPIGAAPSSARATDQDVSSRASGSDRVAAMLGSVDYHKRTRPRMSRAFLCVRRTTL
ncbi:hypothetical protein GCM10007854_13140 [Algimonas porphyrae]|uniref:Uncharacterized protein n=1 Tax=Algimonas porphyrae TaxID=1128113 RepID=A0ABQ5UYI1_9PROT|nr:hypothetical protein GCM10007854_13140 [Algimonas porphyrae]